MEVTRLRRRFTDAGNAHDKSQWLALMVENERLVLAALASEVAAEKARQDLAQLTWSSQRDPLTNTPNRVLMRERLTSAITMAQRRGAHLAVLFLDIDKFKQINDTLGHTAGDDVLQLVARSLESVVRAVSYTHLDVYKRQDENTGSNCRFSGGTICSGHF